ncbi:MAG: ferritin [Methanomicrobiales archaeon]|jgi:ferritin|nr:ferritin [Methanoregulaceae archaeon]HNI41271.1 ferritin [Methanoregulaceae archaeon]HNJ80658.1 ferritin [Methanoregulaceae archaeon]HNL86036.1 ferritin [Methanoregulaceae archaeon]HNO07800.1 ferritin [Methanoregulaceae archaeon]
MLKKSVEDALNKQVNAEFYSSYLYLAMSAYFESYPMKGFANWLRLQAKEEMAHGMKIYEYIIEAGGTPKLTAIDAPKTPWKSAQEVFEEVYAHEQKVTGLIYALVELSQKEKDYATKNFLGWFVKEQVEEEANASDILAQIKIVGNIPGHLFWLDHQLGKRE